MLRIADVSVPFPDGWYAVPRPCPDPARWAADLAGSLLTAPAQGQVDGAVDDAARAGALESLTEQLAAVASALAAPEVDTSAGAVLVPDPDAGFVAAMAAVSVARELDRGTYELEVDAAVADALERGAFHAVRVESTCPLGVVRGVYVVDVEERDPDDPEEVLPNLVERVQVAVFPEGSADAVELVLLPSSLGVFTDTVRAAVALLDDATLGSEAIA